MTARAYAKINFGLHIRGKRADGYHELETVFLRVNINDTISFAPCNSLQFSCSDPDLAAADSNLCLKAARLLLSEANVTQGVEIRLQKSIPIGAGLGGGSSDAAATLVGLNDFLALRLPKELLTDLAAQLGSDIPFFTQASPAAYATGRGELLSPLELSLPFSIVIVYPDVQISTSWAYSRLQLTKHTEEKNLREIVLEAIGQPPFKRSEIRNDFEPLVFSHYPQVSAVHDTLRRSGAVFAQLSGSGSAVYGLFEKEPRGVAEQFPLHYRIFITPPHFAPET